MRFVRTNFSGNRNTSTNQTFNQIRAISPNTTKKTGSSLIETFQKRAVYQPKPTATNYTKDSIIGVDRKKIPTIIADKNNAVTLESDQNYRVMTPVGEAVFRVVQDGKNRSVKTIGLLDGVSTNTSLEVAKTLEETRQFLSDLDTLATKGTTEQLTKNRSTSELKRALHNLGIDSTKPFAVKGQSSRYLLDNNGELQNIDEQSKAIRTLDWRLLGYDKNTKFLIQGKEYHLNADGKLPLPDTYVHKKEEFQIVK